MVATAWVEESMEIESRGEEEEVYACADAGGDGGDSSRL